MISQDLKPGAKPAISIQQVHLVFVADNAPLVAGFTSLVAAIDASNPSSATMSCPPEETLTRGAQPARSTTGSTAFGVPSERQDLAEGLSRGRAQLLPADRYRSFLTVRRKTLGPDTKRSPPPSPHVLRPLNREICAGGLKVRGSGDGSGDHMHCLRDVAGDGFGDSDDSGDGPGNSTCDNSGDLEDSGDGSGNGAGDDLGGSDGSGNGSGNCAGDDLGDSDGSARDGSENGMGDDLGDSEGNGMGDDLPNS